VNPTPGGTAPAWPIVTVNGPISNPTITNVTTGLLVSFPGLVVSSIGQLVVDMWNETAVVGSQSVAGYLNQSVSTYWSLTNGVSNTVRVSGTGTTGSTTSSITFRDTYI
jgi:hypothetical protein